MTIIRKGNMQMANKKDNSGNERIIRQFWKIKNGNCYSEKETSENDNSEKEQWTMTRM